MPQKEPKGSIPKGMAMREKPSRNRARARVIVFLSRGLMRDCEHSDKLPVERGAVKEFDPNTLAFWWG